MSPNQDPSKLISLCGIPDIEVLNALKIHEVSMSDCNVESSVGRILKFINEPCQNAFYSELERLKDEAKDPAGASYEIAVALAVALGAFNGGAIGALMRGCGSSDASLVSLTTALIDIYRASFLSVMKHNIQADLPKVFTSGTTL